MWRILYVSGEKITLMDTWGGKLLVLTHAADHYESDVANVVCEWGEVTGGSSEPWIHGDIAFRITKQ